MARPLGTADLDPLEAAAAPISPDPAVGKGRSARHRSLVAAGMSEEEAAAAMLAEDRAALPRAARAPMADDVRAAVGRGSLQPTEANLLMRERDVEQTAQDLGMPQQYTLPPHWRDAAAGDDMVGRFRFRSKPGGGLEAVDTSPSEADQQAEFAKWANETPGSERQALYNPAGHAAWEDAIRDQQHQDYLAEVERYGSAEGRGWRGRLTPAQLAARDERALLDRQRSEDRQAQREAFKTDPRYADVRARQEARAKELERRATTRRLMTQNPFLTLGDPSLNDFQRQVLSEQLLGSPGSSDDPRVRVAKLESDARARDRQATLDAQTQLADKDRTARSEEARLERDARAAEMKLAREAEDRRWSDRSSSEERKYDERRQTEDLQFQERMQAMRNQSDLQARDIDARLAQLNASNDLANRKMEEQARNMQQAQVAAFRQTSPGLHDIMTGRSSTQAAADSLMDIARRSDRFQYLPGGGFGLREATAMNDELLALAAQAQQLGIDTPLARPEYRRQLINSFGYNSGWSGGRGGWFGDWFRPMPDGL